MKEEDPLSAQPPAGETAAATAAGGAPQEVPEPAPGLPCGEQAGPPKKRMVSVELCRIVCMLMVIFNHTLNQFYGIAGAGGYFATYVNFINICAVGTFLIITGFFMFDGKFSYGKRLKKLFLRCCSRLP